MRAFTFTAIILLVCTSLYAQYGLYDHIYSPYSGLSSEPIIFSEVNLNSFESISAALQYSKKDDLQKVVIAPFKLFSASRDSARYTFLHETKFNLAQKDNITTLGIGLGFDEAAPAGRTGIKLLKDDLTLSNAYRLWQINYPPFSSAEITALLEAIDSIKRFDFLYDSFSPAKLREVFPNDQTYENYINTERPNAKRQLFDMMHNRQITNYDEYDEFRQDTLSEINTSYYERLIQRRWRVTVGANVSLFEILAGTKVDKDSNMLLDNYYKSKQIDLSVGVTRTMRANSGFSATAHYSTKRAKAEESQKLIPYLGFSVSVSKNIFILNKQYRRSEDYRKSLFIPAIAIGASVEYQKVVAKDLTLVEDNIDKVVAYTVFCEFRIKPLNQFKLSIPLKATYYLNNNENVLNTGPILEYRLQLSGN